jgi:hypothetical protein
VSDLGLSDAVAFVEPCAPTEVVKSGRDYDIGVVCHRGSTPNHDVAVPNKLMDYIGAGLAVAGSDLRGVRSILEIYECGLAIDPTDGHTMARDLGELVGKPDVLTDMKHASVRACEELCWARQAELLINEYGMLLCGEDPVDDGF